MAQFVTDIVRQNGLSDGLYVEPYAGGAAVAWELLLTGVVRRVSINDINKPVFYFWDAVINNTEKLSKLIFDTEVNVVNHARLRSIFRDNLADPLDIGFAMFFLNRTQRSGILNGGIIGGKAQTGQWKIDARYNKPELIRRVELIASKQKNISVSNMDAIEFLKLNRWSWSKKTIVYLDPPYYEKGRDLYYDFYKHDDHVGISKVVQTLNDVSWIVSYDDIMPIHELYAGEQWLQYSIGYSARDKTLGREAMFFSDNLDIPAVSGSMKEIFRGTFHDNQLS